MKLPLRTSGLTVMVLGGLLVGTINGEDGNASRSVKMTAGLPIFLDADTHYAIGGAGDFRVSKRVGLEIEFLYMYESSVDQDFTLVPSITYALTDPSEKVVPYLIGGVGLIGARRPNVRFPGFRWRYGYSVGGGIGARFFFSDGWFLAPEVRAGREPFLRITGSFGYQF